MASVIFWRQLFGSTCCLQEFWGRSSSILTSWIKMAASGSPAVSERRARPAAFVPLTRGVTRARNVCASARDIARRVVFLANDPPLSFCDATVFRRSVAVSATCALLFDPARDEAIDAFRREQRAFRIASLARDDRSRSRAHPTTSSHRRPRYRVISFTGGRDSPYRVRIVESPL